MEPNKNDNKSFLDKFSGKTNKIGKSGINTLLTNNQQSSSPDQQGQDQHLRKVDLDSLIPSNPPKQNNQPPNRRTKALTKTPGKPQKQ